MAFCVIDMRGESHSVALLRGYANVVVFIQDVVQQHAQLGVALSCLAQTFSFATISGGVDLVLELDNDYTVVLTQLWWRFYHKHVLAEFPEHFVQAVPQAGGESFDPPFDHIKADELHQVCSVQHADQIGVVTLPNHLKLGSIREREWNSVGVIWEGGRWLHLSVIPDVFGRKIGNALSLHVKDTCLLGTQEPLVAATAVAVTVHVFQVMVECAPGLRAIHMHVDVLVFFVDLFDKAFGRQARAA